MLGFQSFWTARRTLAGVEAMAMLAKGQVRAVPANDMLGPASLRAPGLWPRHLSEGERAGARLQSANATDPDQALRIPPEPWAAQGYHLRKGRKP